MFTISIHLRGRPCNSAKIYSFNGRQLKFGIHLHLPRIIWTINNWNFNLIWKKLWPTLKSIFSYSFCMISMKFFLWAQDKLVWKMLEVEFWYIALFWKNTSSKFKVKFLDFFFSFFCVITFFKMQISKI